MRRPLVTCIAAVAIAAGLAVAPLASADPQPKPCGAATDEDPRCPVDVYRSPDLPSYWNNTVASPDGRRVYSVGPDESGWMAFTAVDAHSLRLLEHTTVHLGHFATDSSGGLNGFTVGLTRDGSMLLSCGWLVAPSGEVPAVVAFDTATGNLRWSWVGPNRGRQDEGSALAVDSRRGRAFAAVALADRGRGTTDALLLSFDVGTGRVLWRHQFGHDDGVEQYPNALVLAGRRLLVAGDFQVRRQGHLDDDATVISLDASTGRPERRVGYDAAHDYDSAYSAVRVGGTLYVAGPSIIGHRQEVTVLAVSLRSMRARWATQLSDPWPFSWTPALVVSGRRIIVASNEFSNPISVSEGTDTPAGSVYADLSTFARVTAVDRRTGRQLWTTPLVDAGGIQTRIASVVHSWRGDVTYLLGWSSSQTTAVGVTQPIGVSPWRPPTSDGFVAAVDNATGTLVWTSRYNDDRFGRYDSYFMSGASVPDGLIGAGVMDTRSWFPWTGTINGTIVRYAP